MNIKKLLIILAVIVAIAIPSFLILQTKADNNPANTPQDASNINTALLNGTVASLNPLSVQVSSTMYSVGTQNAKLMDWFGAQIIIDDIKMNDKIWVKGAITGNNIKADTIVNQSLPAGATQISGMLTAKDGNTMMLKNDSGQTKIMADDQTAYIKDKQKATIDDLTIDSNIQVVGIMDTNNNYLVAKYIAVVDNNTTTTNPTGQ